MNLVCTQQPNMNRRPNQTSVKNLKVSMRQQNPHDILTDLMQSQFYGSLEIKFEAGRVVLIKKTETFKPNNDQRSNRGNEQRQANTR